MRRFAVGDIHGCRRTFRALLEKIQFDRKTELYLMGDYIDRGPDSAGVVLDLAALVGNGYRVFPGKGNHEDLMLLSVDRTNPLRGEHYKVWLANGGQQTLDSIDQTEDPDQTLAAMVGFLAALPEMIVLDDYVLVHAGLDFSRQDPVAHSSSEDRLWTRNYTANRKKLQGRRLVTGHTPQSCRFIRACKETHHIQLDNGCFQGNGRNPDYGCLVAYDMDNDEFFFQPCLDRDPPAQAVGF